MGRISKSDLISAIAKAERQIEHGDPDHIERQIEQKKKNMRGIRNEIGELESDLWHLEGEVEELEGRLKEAGEDGALPPGQARSLRRQQERYTRYLDQHYPGWNDPQNATA